ncbi:MAG: hypothetical protein ACMZ7B_07925 [Balneola sp.]
MPDEKDMWRENWLDSINELTDFELQKKSWLNKKNKNPHWSFIEFISCYFDDLLIEDFGYEHFLEKKWLTREEYLSIKNWHEELSNYKSPKNDDYNHQAILSDKDWKRIVLLGFNSKEALYKLISEEEKRILLKKLTT